MAKLSKGPKQTEFLILLSLMDGAKHGYEIAKFIEGRSNGFFRIPFGTLYPILHRLEKESLVTHRTDGSERDKKTYKLTPAGRRHAQGEVTGYQQFLRAMNRFVPG